MHLLIALIAVAVVVFLLTRAASSVAPARGGPLPWGLDQPAPAGSHDLAFLSRGKLFLHSPGQPIREIHSKHVQDVMDRLERSRQLHGWKQDTSLAMSFSGRRGQGENAEEMPLQASSVRFIGPGRILYFLRDNRVGGLFEQDLATGREARLLHRQNLSFEDLNLNEDGSRLLCSQHAANGSANIAWMNADGSDFHELSGGDTVDCAPAWVPGEPALVLFQTAGIARSQAGQAIGAGAVSIQMLDTAKGSLTPVVDDAAFDHLQPRVGKRGELYFIRRPFERPSYSNASLLTDTLMFPFRLLRAIFHYLNFFSLMYTRKPLTSASGPMLEADLKEIMLKGKRIDAKAALRRGHSLHGVPSLVPKTWQLVMRQRNGQETILADHVVSYDLANDGCVYYSNGYGVFRLDANGGATVVLKDHLISEFVVGENPLVKQAVEPAAASRW